MSGSSRQRAQQRKPGQGGQIPYPSTPPLEAKQWAEDVEQAAQNGDAAKWRALWRDWDLFWLGLDWRTWPEDKPVPRSRCLFGKHVIIWDDGTETPVDRSKRETG
jgi:hypothetical protein